MTKPRPAVIEQDNYEVALKLARENWRKLDPALQAELCGAGFSVSSGQARLALPFLGRPTEVTHPEGEVRFAKKEEEPAMWEQILVLHYLASNKPVPDSEKLIAFSEIPDGRFYDAAYQKRTRNFLLGVCGNSSPNEPERRRVSTAAFSS